MESRQLFTSGTQSSWQFWLVWVLASTIGWVVGAFIGYALGESLIWVGISVGTAQWLILRRLVPRSGWWVLATAVGWLMSAIVNDVVRATVGTLGANIDGISDFLVGIAFCGLGCSLISGAVSGSILGIAQWLVLRRVVSRSILWLPVNIVFGAVGFPVINSLGLVLGVSPVILGLVVGIMSGVFSGGVLVWLLHQPRPVEDLVGSVQIVHRTGWRMWFKWLLVTLTGLLLSAVVIGVLDRSVGEIIVSQVGSLVNPVCRFFGACT